jgi:hypothetical protein
LKLKYYIPLCPITQALLKDPVMDPEGSTYEKSDIMAWLQLKHFTFDPETVDR